MGETTVALGDAKAGYSSWCRRGEHRTCRTVTARCTCTCHGRHGQQPPTSAASAPKSKETTMNATAAEVTQLRPPPDVEPEKPAAGHACPDCDRTFATPQARGAHRAKAHGYRNPPAAKPAAKSPRTVADAPTPATPPAPTNTDPWLLVVLTGDDQRPSTRSIVVTSEHDARQTAELLTELGHTACAFRLADG